MAFNRFKRPRLGLGLGIGLGLGLGIGLGLGLGLGLPIAPFGAFRTLRLHLYMLPHEVVKSRHQLYFVNISMLFGVLRVRIGWQTRIISPYYALDRRPAYKGT